MKDTLNALDVLVQCTIETVGELPVLMIKNKNQKREWMRDYHRKKLAKDALALKKAMKSDKIPEDILFSKFHFLSSFLAAVQDSYAAGDGIRANPVVDDWLKRLEHSLSDFADSSASQKQEKIRNWAMLIIEETI